jgi:diguanylate cyclase (GGDEF)-like protein
LTGLPDKGAFQSDLLALVAEATKSGLPLALLMIDADHLKRVNDMHSLAKGDEVLRELAERLQAAMTGKGTAYRWGGEEVTALLPNHTLNEALAVAERIRASVAALPVADVAVTVSIGVAVLPDHAPDGGTLFKAADAAVFDAKKQGRNLVRYHGERAPSRARLLVVVAGLVVLGLVALVS